MHNKFLSSLFISLCLLCHGVLKAQPTKTSMKVEVMIVDQKKLARISVDNSIETTGILQLINKDGIVVTQIDQIELIKSPFYFSMDVTEYPAGEYTFTIITSNEKNSDTASIQ